MTNNTTYEGLPVQFVTSLRVLFDILDEGKCGVVKLSDLETRWEDGTVDGLPAGVIQALRKVAPSNGKLTFDRFLAGLRMALLRHRTDNPQGSGPKQMRNYTSSPAIGQGEGYTAAFSNNKQAAGMQHRTASMPVLQNQTSKQNVPSHNNNNGYQKIPLNNWTGKLDMFRNSESHGMVEFRGRRPGDGRSSIASASALEFLNGGYSKINDDDAGKRGNRRREPRRHTLANGVDHNMIKRLKQFEQEKQILSQGLEMTLKAKEWYEEQLCNVEQKMKYVGRTDTHGDQSIEASEERLNLQQARIQELNQQLRALVDSSQKGFALHMNLAVTQSPHRNEIAEKENVISMLKSQNRMLTKEVSEKSDKISQLDKEKTQLIRKMFEATSEKHRSNYDDTTFI